MDVPRGKEVARKKLIKRIIIVACILIAIPVITVALSRLKPAAPEVERATVWIDTVKRGPMVREVRGLGKLTVEDVVVKRPVRRARPTRDLRKAAPVTVARAKAIVAASTPYDKKLTKAQKAGVPLLTEADLVELLGRR